MHEEDLAGLMSAYQQGDLAAFERLYLELRPRLQQYLHVLTHDRQRAEDLLQETFLQLHRSRRTYMPERPVMPWAIAIARHVYVAEVRRRARLARREVSMNEPPDLPVPALAEATADRRLLQRALAQLPVEQREAVLLHHVWGYTFEEIGATLGVQPVAAKLRAFRGLRKLRQLIDARA